MKFVMILAFASMVCVVVVFRARSGAHVEPATLTFGIVWKDGAPTEGRTGPYPKRDGVEWPTAIFLESEMLSASPDRVHLSADTTGFPAVTVELTPEDAVKFESLTGRNVDRPMAILVDGVVVSIATINEPLPGSAQISCRFTQAQADELIAKLTR